jgi:hypothetical protein
MITFKEFIKEGEPSLRPAVKHGNKIYKGESGEAHHGLLPKAVHDYVHKHLDGDYGRTDEVPGGLKHGFLNHRGHFLNHLKAGAYAADHDLVPKELHDLVRKGGLTSEDLPKGNKT